MHIAVDDVTENALQNTMVRSFDTWLTGKMPKRNHLGMEFPKNPSRAVMGNENHVLRGGHIGVYVGCVADQLWLAQHFR
jgi:hypothetical protein